MFVILIGFGCLVFPAIHSQFNHFFLESVAVNTQVSRGGGFYLAGSVQGDLEQAPIDDRHDLLIKGALSVSVGVEDGYDIFQVFPQDVFDD